MGTYNKISTAARDLKIVAESDFSDDKELRKIILRLQEAAWERWAPVDDLLVMLEWIHKRMYGRK